MDVRLASCSLPSISLFLAVCISTLKGVLPVCDDIGSLSSELVSLGGPASEVRLECLDFGSYKWWSSKNSCQTTMFTEYEDCNNTQMCAIPLSSLMEEFFMYFCCTRNNVFFLGGVNERKCFQIKLCPEITDFWVPPIMFVQSQEKVYISVQASPPPPSRHLRIFLEGARGTSSRELNYTSVQETTSITNSTYIHIFEVPSDVPQGATITFEATLNLETCEGAYKRRMTQKILNDSLPSTCTVSSGSLTVPSTTAMTVLPTPSPSPESCPTTSCTEAVLASVVPLSVIVAVLLCTTVVIVISCVIACCQRRPGCVCTVNSDDQSRSHPTDHSRPTDLHITALHVNGNGAGNGEYVHAHGPESPQYATVSSNVSTPYTPPHQEQSLLMPPTQNGEELYGRRHDGNTDPKVTHRYRDWMNRSHGYNMTPDSPHSFTFPSFVSTPSSLTPQQMTLPDSTAPGSTV